MATITATTGNDFIAGGTDGNDSIDALFGNDTILGTLGNDLIDCGETTSIVYWRNANFGDFDIVAYADGFVLNGPMTANARIVADLELGTVLKYGGNTLLGTDTLIGVDGLYGTEGSDRISGRDFWDYEEFQGYSGNDTIDGRGGNDAALYRDDELNTQGIVVNLAAGTVTGDASVGSDTLRQIELVGGTSFGDRYDATGFGGLSVNRSSYGEGFNQFTGFAGNDTVVGNGETFINYSGAGGAVSVNLGLLSALGVAANVLVNANTGNFSNNGYAPGDDLVSGAYGVRGTRFNDTLVGGGRVNDLVTGETLSGDVSFERFRGDAGNDSISGGTGFDRVDHGSSSATATGLTINLAAGTVSGDANSVGNDTLRGIEGVSSTAFDDSYNAVGFTLSNAASASVNSGDVVVELPEGETLASLAFNEFRALGGDDTVTGNGATRIHFGGMAVETLTGPQPSVVVSFSSASAGNAVMGQTDGGLGTVVFSGVYAIRGGVADDSVTGAAGFQSLEGYYGNDTLIGGDGSDRLYGHLRRTGDDESNRSTTFTDNDSLVGGAGNDELVGHFGNDTLVGGAGNDTMSGGTGNDVYEIDEAGDLAQELADGGTDTVNASLSYTLGGQLENLLLVGDAVSGTGNTLANRITGNAAANTLGGSGGNDTLNGGAGADTMRGGIGNDVYLVNAATDRVVESAGQGTDTVQSTAPNYTLAANVERLTLTGANNTNGTGNDLANILSGNSGANLLRGQAGNDSLVGGGGNDTLAGGVGNDTLAGAAGADVFRFDVALSGSNVDALTDFSAVADSVELDDAVFTAIGAPGALAATAFRAGTAATTAAHRIVYDQASGTLSYDADGSGAGAAVVFAHLVPGTVLSAADLFVI